MHRLRGLSRGGRLVLALAIGAAVFGIATAVQASIPDSSGVMHGCYNTSLAHGNPTGALRVIDTAKPNGSCTSWETAVSWNANGVSGARGPTGAPGPTGPKGTTGSKGTSGTRGPSGQRGPTGPTGASGIYHASGYLNGVDGGSSPEVTGITRQSVGIFLIHFSVDVSACGRVATLGIPSNQQNNAALFKGFPGEISTFFDLVSQSVVVATRDSSGTLADQDWQLLVAC